MTTTTKAIKPLGKPIYGSIPHLPNSRLGTGEHHVNAGQARIATVKARDKHDIIIVQEKLDGTNVGIAKIGGEIVPLVRAGYRAVDSPREMHRHFHEWAMTREKIFQFILGEGERLVGEWLLVTHGIEYDLRGRSPFVAFDLIGNDGYREYGDKLTEHVGFHGIATAPTLHADNVPISVEMIMERLSTPKRSPYGTTVYGEYGALEVPEGAVWRVERHGKLDFMCKFVRQDFEPGKHLSDKEERWNIVGDA